MQLLALRSVSVWLDDLAPERGAFAHALEWASRLGLPLHATTSPRRGCVDRTLPELEGHAMRSRPPASWVVPAEKLAACATACAHQGVAWDACPWYGPWNLGVEQFLRPVELCVFGNALPRPLKEELLRRSLQRTQTSVLVCPRAWRPVTRVLVLREHRDPGNGFWDGVVQLCRALQITPVVLTVARSEAEARRRQQLTQETLAGHGLPADFDFVVGCEVRTAVASVARWRRCSHVFVEKRNAFPWWRWLRGDTIERLLGLSDSLTFLALPSGGQSAPSTEEAHANGTVGPVKGPR